VISVVTSTRAEFGLLRPLLKLLGDDLQLVVTGAHLSPITKYSVQEIEFPIAKMIHNVLADDSYASVVKSDLLLVHGLVEYWSEHRPDVVVCMGDRHEMLAAGTCAFNLDIPVVHIGGGDSTPCHADNVHRAALSAMASLHFPQTEKSAERVARIMRSDSTLEVVGALGAWNVVNIPLLPLTSILKNIPLRERIFLVTWHTMPDEDVSELIMAMMERTDATIVWTFPGHDPGYLEVVDRVKEYSYAWSVTESLGSQKYLSLMSYADLVIGNSSSGIIEAPAVKTVTVNVGKRQEGREQHPSCVNVKCNTRAIGKAIDEALAVDWVWNAKVHTYYKMDTPKLIRDGIQSWMEGRKRKEVL